jgi:DNA-binding transcriptional LysR family regulator
VSPLVIEVERSVAAIKATSKEPSGLIRVTASVAFGQAMLVPIVARYLELAPKVKVELALSDERLNVVGEGFDIAIRMGELKDSELLSRKLLTINRRIVASPSYISKYGHPKTVNDLKEHMAVINSPSSNVWTFETEEGVIETRVNWRISMTGMVALTEAAKLGLGIALVPSFLADRAIEAGELVSLDIGARPISVDATALFHQSRNPSPAVRHFLNYLVGQLSNERDLPE